MAPTPGRYRTRATPLRPCGELSSRRVCHGSLGRHRQRHCHRPQCPRTHGGRSGMGCTRRGRGFQQSVDNTLTSGTAHRPPPLRRSQRGTRSRTGHRCRRRPRLPAALLDPPRTEKLRSRRGSHGHGALAQRGNGLSSRPPRQVVPQDGQERACRCRFSPRVGTRKNARRLLRLALCPLFPRTPESGRRTHGLHHGQGR